jgi:NAD(P)H-dependent nitrite reductase small subunit
VPRARLIALPYPRERYLGRVASVVDRYLAMQAIRGAPARGQRVRLLYEHPSGWAELERLTDELVAQRLRAARAELASLRDGAPLPAPIDEPARTTVLAVADLEWLMRETRALARRSRRFGVEAALAAYHERSKDRIEGADRALIEAIRAVPRGRRLGLMREVAALRHGVRDLAAHLLPSAPVASDPVTVCKLDELREGRPRRIQAGDKTIAVFKHEGCVYALDDTCPHRGGPLGKGEVKDGRVFCPLHGWAFELATGRMRGNENVSVRTYETTVDDDGTIRVVPE